MDFIHSREYLTAGQSVRVDCDTECNVMLTDDSNFQRYRRGDSFEYRGGFFQRFPAIIPVTSTGYWNVTIDLGGARAQIRYDISILG